MLALTFSQIALAAATAMGGPTGRAAAQALPRQSEVVTPGKGDNTALDILNNTRPDILGHGAARHCPPVKAVYVDDELRLAPAVVHGFSRATLYFAGDTVMIMLPPSVADALRTVPARAVRTIRYVDCRAATAEGEERNTLRVTTK